MSAGPDDPVADERRGVLEGTKDDSGDVMLVDEPWKGRYADPSPVRHVLEATSFLELGDV